MATRAKAAALIGDSIAAGLVIGLIETARLAGGGGLWIGVLATGLTVLAALAVGVPSLAIASWIGRQRWARAWLADLRPAGPSRVRAIWRALVFLASLAAIFAATYLLTVRTFGRFNAAGALGLLHGTAVILAAASVAALALWADERFGPRLARIDALAWLLAGWRGTALLVLGLGGAAVALGSVARAAAPAADFRPLAVVLALAACLATAAIVGLSRRLPGVALAGLIAGGALLGAASLSQLDHRDLARARVASAGIPSRLVLRTLWRLSDRDGDGFASRFGGGDCDDSDPRINPDAEEIVDNGLDDNCADGDVSAADLAHRLTRVPSSAPEAARHNVFLITVDALRADHVGSYGYPRPTTPHLDRLAARGTQFEWAITPSPTTRRAIPAMMAARYASTMAFVEGGDKKIWPPYVRKGHHEMLGESFAAAGYQTAAILCCTTLFDKRMGIVEGIQHIDAEAARRRRKYHGDILADKIEEWMRSGRDPERPFFLWVHFLDAHNPYEQLPGAPVFGGEPIDRYDSEIAYVDDKIGRMIAAVDAAGLTTSTIVAVSSDHGDEFLEHGNEYHGRSLYNEVIRVPLIVAAPGRDPAVATAPVSVIDVGPTLLDLVGLTRPTGQNGRSLAAAIGTGELPERMVLAELIADRNITRNLRAGFLGDWKLIWDLDANTYELYSLSKDPGDTDDRRGRAADVFEELRRELHRQTDLELSLLPIDREHQRRERERRKARRR